MTLAMIAIFGVIITIVDYCCIRIADESDERIEEAKKHENRTDENHKHS